MIFLAWEEVLIAHPTSSRRVRVDQSQFEGEPPTNTCCPHYYNLFWGGIASKNLGQSLCHMKYEIILWESYAWESMRFKILRQLCILYPCSTKTREVLGNLEGGGDGFPNTSLVLVEHGYIALQCFLECPFRCFRLEISWLNQIKFNQIKM